MCTLYYDHGYIATPSCRREIDSDHALRKDLLPFKRELNLLKGPLSLSYIVRFLCRAFCSQPPLLLYEYVSCNLLRRTNHVSLLHTLPSSKNNHCLWSNYFLNNNVSYHGSIANQPLTYQIRTTRRTRGLVLSFRTLQVGTIHPVTGN